MGHMRRPAAKLVMLLIAALLLGGCNSRVQPTPLPTPPNQPSPTPGDAPTFAPLSTPTPQLISGPATLPPTTPSPTAKPAPTNTAQLVRTATPRPAATATLAPTRTLPPPTATLPPPSNTPLPSDTPVPPTSTPLPPTSTPVPPTSTPVPPTSTPVPEFAGLLVGQQNDTNLYSALPGSHDPQLIADVAGELNSFSPQFPRWSPDRSQIVFVVKTKGSGTGIYLINADGNNLSQLVNADRPELHRDRTDPTLGWPVWSPDGNTVAFTATYSNGDSEVAAINVNSKAIRQVASWKRNSGPDFAPVAEEWSPNGTLMALEMKSRRLTIVQASDGSNDTTFGSGWLGGWGPDGRIYFSQLEDNNNRFDAPVYSADVHGNSEPFAGGALAGWLPRWSPDGKHIYATQGQNGPYVIADADGTNIRPFSTAGLWDVDWK